MRASSFERAERLKAAGFEQAQAGRPTRAQQLFERSLRLLSDPPTSSAEGDLRARLLLGLSGVAVDLVSVPAALELLELAAVHAAASTDRSLPPLVDVQRGDLFARDGRVDEALACLDAAATHLDRLLIDNQCALLLNRGILHLSRGALRRAEQDFSGCANIAEAGGLPEMAFKARSNLGWTQFLAGDIPAALATMASAADMDVDVERGILTMDRARILTEAGLVREAEASLVEAEAEFVRLRRTHDRADAELARAECALIAGDPTRAATLAQRAARRFERRGSQWWAAMATLTALHAQLTSGRLRTAGIADALDLHKDFRQRGQTAHARAAALIAAELLVGGGQVGPAQDLLARDGGPRASDRIGLRIQGRVVAAKIALAQDDRRAARRAITRGIAEIAAHQLRFGSLDLRTAAAIHGVRLMQMRVDLALDDGRAGAVFDAAEHVRSISSRLPPVRPPRDERTADLLAELRGLVENLRTADAVEALALRRRRLVVEAEITARTWTHGLVNGIEHGSRPAGRDPTGARPGGDRSAPDAHQAGYAQVRAELVTEATDMVSFIRSGDDLLAVVAGPGRGRVVALADSARVREILGRIRADLDALSITRLPAPLRTAVAASLARSLDWIDDRMIRPLGLRGRRLVVIAGGAAATVPWGCLPSLVGVPVSVAPSATWWLRMRHSRTPFRLRSGDARVVALAGPGLPRSDEEAETVAGVWAGGVALRGRRASTGALAEALGTADIVHVAAHGRHEAQNPLFSSVRLDDGVLFAHELGHAGRPAAHVVLSACELGLATIRPGDEALGLTSVLLHHGTRSVVAGVARVGDDVAAETMAGYHRALAGGLAPAQALAGVVHAGPFPAPFVCFGAS